MPNALPEPLLWNAFVGVAVAMDENAEAVELPAAGEEDCMPNALPELLPWNTGVVVADESAGVHCLLKDELANPGAAPVC